MSREFGGGWETGNVVAEGFTGTGSAAISSVAANLHLDRFGFGGSYCIIGVGGVNGNRHFRQAYANVRNLVECWDRDLCYIGIQATSVGRSFVHTFNTGITELGSVSYDCTTGIISAHSGTATLLATSASGVFPYSRYFVMAIHFRMLDAGGLYEVYIDDVLVLTFSGDTKPGAETTFNSVGYFCGPSTCRLDEFCRNSITLEYDNGVGGIPTVGQTVTGGTSGATAVITNVEGNAVSGVLVLRTWNGTNFQNNEAITTPALLNAQVNAPDANYISGFQPNSTKPGEGFVSAIIPSGVGATTQLTSSTGGANWDNVNEIPPNSTDYNSSGTADQYDTYAATDLPTSATFVISVMGWAYAQRDNATINNFRHVVRTGGVDYFGTNTALPTSYGTQFWSWNVNPGTLTAWTVAEVNGSEHGFQVRA